MSTLVSSACGDNNRWRTYMIYSSSSDEEQWKLTVRMGLETLNGWIEVGTRVASLIIKVDGVTKATYTFTKKDKREAGKERYIYINDKTFILKRTHDVQTVTFTGKITYSGNSDRNGTRSVSHTFNVQPLEKFTYSFDSAKSSLNHWYGELTTIHTAPTKVGYEFLGWQNNGNVYPAGSSVNINDDAAFTAVWKKTYTPPSIGALRAYRVMTPGSAPSPDVKSNGTCGYCDFVLNSGSGVTVTGYKVRFGTGTDKNMTKTGTTVYGYSEASQALSTDTQYPVTVTVSYTAPDGSYTISKSTFIAAEFITMNFAADGKSVGLLCRAKDEDGTIAVAGDVYVGCSPDGTGGNRVLDESGVYIVESGTKNGWSYKKYSDGTMRASKRITTGSVLFGNDMGTYLHYTYGTSKWELPSGFIEPPIVNANYVASENGTSKKMVLAMPAEITTTNFVFTYIRFAGNVSPMAQDNMWIDCIAEGRWK